MGRLSSAQLRAKKAWETRRARAGKKVESTATASPVTVATGRVGVSKTTWTLEQVNEFNFVGLPVGDNQYRVLTLNGRPAFQDSSF